MLNNTPLPTTERWKDILTYEGIYRISDHGRILAFSENKIRVARISARGYFIIDLRFDKVARTFYVHRLVALHFVGIPGYNQEVNHIDGNKLNNHFKNLEWGSHQENIEHAVRAGLWGEGNKKNSKPVVNTITGETFASVADLAKATGVSRRLMSFRLNGVRRNKTPYRFQ